MFNIKKKILLGSGSPRRILLLKELGLNFRVLISDADETPLSDHLRGDIAKYLSEKKAEALKNKIHENEILITADTIVWLDSSMLGKPANSEEAVEMLNLLSGRRHQVYTGVTLTDQSSKKTFCVESNVVFKTLNEIETRKYIQEYQPYDKAGSYGAQECLMEGVNPCSKKEIQFLKNHGIELFFERTLAMDKKKHIPIIEHIQGGYFNVMGLPVVELIDELEAFDC